MLVSVIIPCYNAEKFITRAVESAINQTYRHTEIICINNNSSDKTWELLLQLKDRYPWLIIDKETKPGASAARNKGIQLSKGEWLQFLDADDELLPSKVEHQVSLVQNDPADLAFVAGNCESILINSSFIYSPYYHFKPEKGLWVSLINSELGCTCSNLFKAEVIKAVGGWNEQQASSQENELMFRIIQRFRNVLYDDASLTLVYSSEGSITNTNSNQNAIRHIGLRERIHNYLRSEKLMTDQTTDAFYRSVYNSISIIAASDKKEARQLVKQYFFKKLISDFEVIRSAVLRFKLLTIGVKLYTKTRF